MRKSILVIIILTVLVVTFVGVISRGALRQAPSVSSFATCVSAGYPVTSTIPRQCRTPDGRTYAEEIPVQATYANATVNDIAIDLPYPGAVTGKTFTVTGRARGSWYFEASFPVQVLDSNGKILATTPAHAQGDWMTTNFVPFTATISVPESFIGQATLLLKKDNPSGDPSRDASVTIPITIEY